MHASFSSETFIGGDDDNADLEKNSDDSTQELESISVKKLTSKFSIRSLQNLRKLIITGSDGIGIISDNSVLYGISKLKKLRILTLPDGISDRSLELIALFPELRELNLPAPIKFRKLTSGGIEILKTARPNLIISIAKRIMKL